MGGAIVEFPPAVCVFYGLYCAIGRGRIFPEVALGFDPPSGDAIDPGSENFLQENRFDLNFIGFCGFFLQTGDQFCRWYYHLKS